MSRRVKTPLDVKTTSDGIPLEDWASVEVLARQYADAVTAKDANATERARRKLLRILARLSKKHGERPSILATKSDYIVSASQRASMLERAYKLAAKRRDRKNLTLIASSLAEHHVDKKENRQTAEVWLSRLRKALLDHYDSTEARLLKELSKKVRGMDAAGGV